MHAGNGSRERRATGQRESVRGRLAALEQVLGSQQEEMAAQRVQLAAQREEIERLRAERAEAEAAPASPLILPAKFRGRGAAASSDAAPERANGRHTSRRGLLKLGGIAAAAGLAAGAGELLRPGTAHAATAMPLIPISGDSSAWPTAGVTGTGTNGAPGVYGSSDTQNGVWGFASTASGSGVYGQATGNGKGVYGYSPVGQGVYGYSPNGHGVHATSDTIIGMYGSSTSGDGVWGVSSSGYGVLAASGTGVDLNAFGTGRIQQFPQASVWPPTSGSWGAGESIRDANWDLWLCVKSGTPGIWRKVAAPQVGFAGGALNLLAVAIRLLDTRGGPPVAYHATAQFQAAGVGAIPAGATAVFGHLAGGPRPGVSCGDGSSAIVWPAGQMRPAAVNVVYNNPVDPVGQCLTGTLALVAIGAGGKISLYSQPINPVGVDYLFDCFGFVM